MKARLRDTIHAQPSLHRALRLVGRLRWLTKARLVRASGSSPREHLGYVLWDPELESFSFWVANREELAAHLGELFQMPAAVFARYMQEYEHDPELNERLRGRVRWRPWYKQRMGPGKRAAWYPVVRAMKPEIVVETGIHDGFGSLILLRALARNAAEGAPGKLVSVDVSPFSGELVAPRLRGSWERVIGRTSDVLEEAIGDRRISILFQDTPHSPENQRKEFDVAVRHAADRLLLWDPSCGEASGALEDIAVASGCERVTMQLRSLDHFWTVQCDAALLLSRLHLDRLAAG